MADLARTECSRSGTSPWLDSSVFFFLIICWQHPQDTIERPPTAGALSSCHGLPLDTAKAEAVEAQGHAYCCVGFSQADEAWVVIFWCLWCPAHCSWLPLAITAELLFSGRCSALSADDPCPANKDMQKCLIFPRSRKRKQKKTQASSGRGSPKGSLRQLKSSSRPVGQQNPWGAIHTYPLGSAQGTLQNPTLAPC